MKSNIEGKAHIDINASASQVWKALTSPELIKKYFFGTNAISDWQLGRSIIFTGEWEGKQYVDKGTILEIIPNILLKYNYWSSRSGIEDKFQNYMDITYKLFEKHNVTTLTVVQENIPDEKMKQHSEINWDKVLMALKDLLEKKTEIVEK